MILPNTFNSGHMKNTVCMYNVCCLIRFFLNKLYIITCIASLSFMTKLPVTLGMKKAYILTNMICNLSPSDFDNRIHYTV